MTKKIENFIDNVIEEKKEQFKTMTNGTEQQGDS